MPSAASLLLITSLVRAVTSVTVTYRSRDVESLLEGRPVVLEPAGSTCRPQGDRDYLEYHQPTEDYNYGYGEYGGEYGGYGGEYGGYGGEYGGYGGEYGGYGGEYGGYGGEYGEYGGEYGGYGGEYGGYGGEYGGSGYYENFPTVEPRPQSRLPCPGVCPRTFPSNHTRVRLLPGETSLGEPGCTEVPDILRGQSGSQTPPPPTRRRRQTVGVCSVVRSKQPGPTPSETYTMWVRPHSQHRNGTLIAAGLPSSLFPYALNLNGDRLTIVALGSTREYDRPIKGGRWTHIALQITLNTREFIRYAVFVDGQMLSPPVVMNTGASRFRRQVAGDGSIRNPVFIGISGEPYISGRECVVSTVKQCQAIGYSAYVSVNSPLDLPAAERRLGEVLLLAERSCPRVPAALRDLYVCSRELPPCTRSSIPLQPCRALCIDVATKCGVNRFIGEGDCDDLPEDNCIGEDFSPVYGMFRGDVKNAVYHGSLLTDREIVADYRSGDLPQVAVESDCLCPDPTSSEVTDLLCEDPFGSSTLPRLGGLSVPEAINDRPLHFYDPTLTSWYSLPDLDTLTVRVDLPQRQMVYNISLHVPRPGLLPANITFQLFDNKGQWRDIAYASENCTFRGDSQGVILAPTHPNCRQIGRFDGSVTMGLFDGRSGVTQSRFGVRVPPEIQDFLSGTSVRVVLRGHVYPANTFYGLADITVKGWNVTGEDCECFPGGLMSGLSANDSCDANNRCRCRQGAGDPSVSNYTCFPYTLGGGLAMVPNYGPESGGTIVYITGGFFGSGNVSVIYGFNTPLQVLNVTETQITCRTPNVTGRLPLYRPTFVEVRLYQGTHDYSVVLDERFEFREDPIIESITPLNTFVSGGINQTVVGQHIDSVFAPRMTVTIIYRSGETTETYPQPSSPCVVTNSTQMVCRSPDIKNLPQEYISLLIPGQVPSSRAKRQTTTVGRRPVNNDELQFYLGLILDGLTTYNNVSEVLPEEGIIHVYTNPDIHPWTGDDRLRTFRPYKGDREIIIEGERLTYGCEIKDYDIRIGNATCEVVGLFVGALHCWPPQTKPELGLLQKDGAPAVTATVGNIEEFVGYLEFHETFWDDPTIKGALLGALAALLLLIIIVIAVVTVKKRAKAKKAAAENKYSEPPTLWGSLADSERAELQSCLKPPETLQLGRKVGEGNFGTVFIGRFQENQKPPCLVAVKTLKEKGVALTELREFLEEATLMKDFHHENVLHLVGLVLKDDRPYVVLPLMENGDLRTFITNPNNAFTVKDLLEYGLQVACGMEYLSGMKFVHRDLAARNCMISKDQVVKVADFGLARDIYSNEYYRVENKSRPLPVKWMAPEALDDFRFTVKSDVWSYGVLLWELHTRGKKPYADVDNFEIKMFLKRGKRLEQPTVALDEIYELMLQCWNMNPASRPEFSHIVRELRGVLSLSDAVSSAAAAASSSPDISAEPYAQLVRSVDYATDRQGYDNLHTTQGYLDMSGQVDYVAAARELGMEISDDGYLAPVDGHSPSAKSTGKPKPSPRKHIGSASAAKSQYQNIELIQSGSSARRPPPPGDDVIQIPAPEDGLTDSDVPVYMNAQQQQVHFARA